MLSAEVARFLGFAPRADVMLAKTDGTRRVWVEFEVSRADPVANHAKFATARMFDPGLRSDVFLAMVSSHVARGRHNLAASMIQLMRSVGIDAFQTVLLPGLAGDEIKRLNHEALDRLFLTGGLDAAAEVERAVAVTELVLAPGAHRIHFAANYLDVAMNVRRWNEAMGNPEGRSRWGNRTVTYFVHDRVSGLFAPSKYCAFVPAPELGERSMPEGSWWGAMDMETYVSLDETESRFDGAVARRHLVERLGMRCAHAAECPADVRSGFEGWLEGQRDTVRVHPRGAMVLSIPDWWL